MLAAARSIARWAGIAAICATILLIPVWTDAIQAAEEASPKFLNFTSGQAAAERKPCRGAFVENSVAGFFQAVNHGDADAIETVVATGSRLRVYSQTQRYGTGTGGFFSSRDRGEVVSHLVERQSKGDRYRARELDPNGYDRAFEICNLGFVVERRIGGGPWKPFVGKGALDWPSGAISVWNVGGECGSGPRLFPCPYR